MKYKNILFTAALSFSIIFCSSSVFASGIFVNNQEISTDYFNNNGTVYVPLRGVFEAMGYKVDYNSNIKTAFFSGKNNVSVRMGDNYIIKNNSVFNLAAPVVNNNGRLYLPLRSMAGALGCTVDWDGTTKTVYIKSDAPAASEQSSLSSRQENHSSDDLSSMEKEVLSLVNAERAKTGAAPLVWDDALARAAKEHSRDMAGNNYFSHSSPSGEDIMDRIKRENAKGSMFAENIAAGSATAKDTLDQWMNSEGHRNNILNPSLKHLGVGIAYDADSAFGYYWTQCFSG